METLTRRTHEEKLAAMAKLEQGYKAGKTIDEVSDELGIPKSTLSTWASTFKQTGDFTMKRKSTKGRAAQSFVKQQLVFAKEKIDKGWSVTRACKKFKISPSSYYRLYPQSEAKVAPVVEAVEPPPAARAARLENIVLEINGIGKMIIPDHKLSAVLASLGVKS